MLIPIFLIFILFYFVIARLLIRHTSLGGVPHIWWRVVLLVVVICSADHAVGYLWARIWLESADGVSGVKVTSDLIAFENRSFDRISRNFLTSQNNEQRQKAIAMMYASSMVGADLDSSGGKPRIQVVGPVFKNSIGPPKAYELWFSSNGLDPACRVFFGDKQDEDAQLLKRWTDLIRANVKDGNSVQCVAVKDIPKITAEFLKRSISYETTSFAKLLGMERQKFSEEIVETASGRIIGECRSLLFGGGRIQRYVLVDLDGGHIEMTLRSSHKCPMYAIRDRENLR